MQLAKAHFLSPVINDYYSHSVSVWESSVGGEGGGEKEERERERMRVSEKCIEMLTIFGQLTIGQPDNKIIRMNSFET